MGAVGRVVGRLDWQVERQADPFFILAAAVLLQAVRDRQYRQHAAAASQWLRAGAGGLPELLGLDPLAVLEALGEVDNGGA